jgi:hypothetical protein
MSNVHVIHAAQPKGVPADTDSGLPDFEGMSVELARFKLTSTTNLEGPEYPNHLDDVVKMFVEGRVTRVDHVVDEKTGALHRVHTIKVVDCIQLPYSYDTSAMFE